MALQQGSIIRVEGVLDERGQNPKPRRMVLITPTAEIASATRLAFVCITSRIEMPLSEDCVLLPFRTGQPHPRTGLTLKSVAVCRWLHVMLVSDPLPEPIGHCPKDSLDRILERVAVLRATQASPVSTRSHDASVEIE